MKASALSAISQARAIAQVPFIIPSSIRCAKHNAEVGGSETSSHLKGLAFDIQCKNSYDRIRIVTALLKSPFTRIGIAKSFIHADVDPDKEQYLMWVY